MAPKLRELSRGNRQGGSLVLNKEHVVALVPWLALNKALSGREGFSYKLGDLWGAIIQRIGGTPLLIACSVKIDAENDL
jgi:hypothetical protein